MSGVNMAVTGGKADPAMNFLPKGMQNMPPVFLELAAKDCFDMFLLELYKCKLCSGYTSLVRNSLMEHFRTEHCSEWENAVKSCAGKTSDNSQNHGVAVMSQCSTAGIVVGSLNTVGASLTGQVNQRTDGLSQELNKGQVSVPVSSHLMDCKGDKQEKITDDVTLSKNDCDTHKREVGDCDDGSDDGGDDGADGSSTSSDVAPQLKDNLQPERGQIPAVAGVEIKKQGSGSQQASDAVKEGKETGIAVETTGSRIDQQPRTLTVGDTLSRQMKIGVHSKYACQACGINFSRSHEIAIHMDTLHRPKNKKFECPLCKKRMTWKSLIYHQTKKVCSKGPKIKATHACHICQKVFHDATALRYHGYSHDKTGQFVCKVCGKRFRHPKSLKQHSVAHNDDAEILQCDLCDYRTKYKSFLSNHRRYKHKAGVFTWYGCELCDFKTTYKASLQKHLEITHVADKNYICEKCGRAYKSQNSLTTHMANHDNKEFKCTQCPYVGLTKARLKDHSKLHLPVESRKYACPHCHWRGFASSALRIHMLKHTGEKPFRCEMCDRGYVTNFGLKKHVRKQHAEGLVPVTLPSGGAVWSVSTIPSNEENVITS
ncbi:putative zinc finger protein 66 [Ptychodera flava]|uniref:putative zinc finger protein 66 n=1 Tax=Ptychodera flava TaxID=63121 RepID=UPI00396A5732